MHLGRHRFPNCLIKKKVSELLDLECINPTGLIYLFEDALRMRELWLCCACCCFCILSEIGFTHDTFDSKIYYSLTLRTLFCRFFFNLKVPLII